MKKVIAIVLFALFATHFMAQETNTLHLKCNFPNIGDTLMVGDRSGLKPQIGTNGIFDMTIPLAEAKLLTIATPGALRGVENNYIFFPAVPGESAELSSDKLGETLDVKGSKFYQDYSSIESAERAAGKAKREFVQNLMEKQKAGANTDSLNKVFNTDFPKIQEQCDEAMLAIIRNNPNNEAVASVIFGLSSREKTEEGYGLLSEKTKNGRLKDCIQTLINVIKEQRAAKEDAEKKQAAGTIAQDFTLTDINDKSFSLSSLKGKYVLLDFWGSWCVWCIKGIPEMKEYYNKYKGKYEIVGIDCNDTQEKWKAAVKEHELPWLHVYNDAKTSTLLADYGVQGFPTKVLIGPDGKIVKTIVGEDPAFYTFLDEIFGKIK